MRVVKVGMFDFIFEYKTKYLISKTCNSQAISAHNNILVISNDKVCGKGAKHMRTENNLRPFANHYAVHWADSNCCCFWDHQVTVCSDCNVGTMEQIKVTL